MLLGARFTAESIPVSGRISVVASFGVGYGSVDVAACTAKDIAVCITPDGVRCPVVASILTMIPALTGKFVIKDRLTRKGPNGFAEARSEHMGVGLVDRILGSIGIGNIGAEMFRLVQPLGQTSPSRYFKKSPEIIRFAVKLNIQCHWRCRCGKLRIYFTSEGSTSATRLCGSCGTGLDRRSQLGPAGNLQLKSLYIKINALLPREGSTAVAFPPPLTSEIIEYFWGF
jgi:hypothetical protein